MSASAIIILKERFVKSAVMPAKKLLLFSIMYDTLRKTCYISSQQAYIVITIDVVKHGDPPTP